MAKGIYKFYWDCGRMGEIKSIFVADSEDVENAIGKEVYFGEILGKHSDVNGVLESGEIKLVTIDEHVIRLFEDFDLKCGYNPLHYISEEDE